MKLYHQFYFALCLLIVTGQYAWAQSQTNYENSLLLVLDVQEYIADGGVNPEEVEAWISEINNLSLKFSDSNIVYVKSIHRVLLLSLKGFQVDTLEGMAFDSRLELKNNIVFQKEKANAFRLEAFSEYVAQKNIDTVFVAGAMAEYCVKETLSGGMDLGYRMVAVPEAILAESDKGKQKVLEKLKRKGIVIQALSEPE